MRKDVLVAPALVLIAAVHAAAQTPPVFTGEVEVINLNVTVTDGRGQYVTGLKPADFAVYEDGVRQQVSLFRAADLPLSIVVLLDTSASMDDKLPVARAAASRFVQTLRPVDMAQVVQFNDRITVLQDFTAAVDRLVAAVNSTEASGPTSLHNALYVSLKDLEKEKKTKGELRRRAVVLLSDGEDTASLVADDQVIELARRMEINVYAISIRGNRPLDRERGNFSRAVHLLTTLARETGGQVHFPNSLSELDSVYERIAEELRTQYNLGYESANHRRDGRWRRIVVRVAGREDLFVRHKLGYYASGK